MKCPAHVSYGGLGSFLNVYLYEPVLSPGPQEDDSQEGVKGEEGEQRGEQGEPEGQVRRLWRGKERRRRLPEERAQEKR